MEIILFAVAVAWATIAAMIMNNFNKDLARLSKWRSVALHVVILVFAPVFFIEELLEILIDVIIGGEEE